MKLKVLFWKIAINYLIITMGDQCENQMAPLFILKSHASYLFFIPYDWETLWLQSYCYITPPPLLELLCYATVSWPNTTEFGLRDRPDSQTCGVSSESKKSKKNTQRSQTSQTMFCSIIQAVFWSLTNQRSKFLWKLKHHHNLFIRSLASLSTFPKSFIKVCW